LPLLSTATHSETDGHESALTGSDPLIGAATFHTGVAAPGAVDVATRPAPSIATHNDVVGQETGTPKPTVSAVVTLCHVLAPPVGSAEVTATSLSCGNV